mmetsp:Transcript_13595/g.16754  ORF Transcript_13595/g.16754 Transcript_13595/m.16754 type:complete len:129 (-) Transcript_13595:2-388(-)
MGNTTNVSASKDNKNDETELKKLKMELQKCREYTHEIRIQYTKQKSKRIAVQYFQKNYHKIKLHQFLESVEPKNIEFDAITKVSLSRKNSSEHSSGYSTSASQIHNNASKNSRLSLVSSIHLPVISDI